MATRTSDETVPKLRERVKRLESALEREREARRRAEHRDPPRRSARVDDHESTRQTYRSRDTDRDRSPEAETSRRVADSASTVSRRTRDAKSRMIRGVTLGAFEGMRAAADAFSSFADGVIGRNEDRGRDRSVQDLLTDLPGDVASGFADAFDDLIDVPARASDRYSRTYREGKESERRRSHSHDDLDHDKEGHSDHSEHGVHVETHADDGDDDSHSAEFSVRAETT